MRQAFLLVAVATLIGLAAGNAEAVGPVDFELASRAGIGTNPNRAVYMDPNPNTLGFGLGGRAGVSFLGFYAGVDLMYYLGTSDDHTLMYGLDLGYSFKVGIVTIRPQLGIGNLADIYTYESSSFTTNYLYFEPGVTGLLSFGTAFVGIDLNLLDIRNAPIDGDGSLGTETALTVHCQAGVHF